MMFDCLFVCFYFILSIIDEIVRLAQRRMRAEVGGGLSTDSLCFLATVCNGMQIN